MKIITLSGVDGSGKSTQLAQLQNILEAKGAKVAYIHAVAFSLPQAARSLFDRPRKGRAPGKAAVKSSFIGVFLRKIVLLIDLMRFHFFVKRLKQTGVEYLLSDRYFYDTLVNIAYLDGTKLDSAFARFATRFIPKPYKAYYLQVTPEKVMERPRKPEQGLQYLKDKTLLFNEAASLWSFVTLDADQPIETVADSLRQSYEA